jgi:hypothetical protein
MIGNEQVRFCAQCNLNVYNLSEMTKAEAERLIARSEGRLCVRYYARADGTILTRNCPTGLRALKKRLTRMANAVASLVLSFFAGVFTFAGLQKTSPAPRYTFGPDSSLGVLVAEPVDEKMIEIREQGEIIKPSDVIVTTGTFAYAPKADDEGRRAKRHR